MKKTLFQLACLIILLSATASYGDQLEKVLVIIEEKGKKIETLTADFTQVKRFSIFNEEQKSSGKLYYKKGGKMAWHYGPPDSNEVYLNNGVAWIYIPDIKQIQKMDLGKDYKISSLLIGFGVPTAELKKNFRIKLVEGGEGEAYVLDFIPKNEEIANLLEKIRVWLDRKNLVPLKTQQFERSKDTTVFEFTDISINQPIKDSFFEFKVPKGVEVVDYSKL